MDRREFVSGAVCAAAGLAAPFAAAGAQGAASKSLVTKEESDALDLWQRETRLAKADIYGKYLLDGDTRSLAALEKLELAFEKVFREAKNTKVEGPVPAVWLLYNMGFIVKTRKTMFSIDLVHRRDAEFAKLLDFALITHNHNDHWRNGFYEAMDGAGKTVVSNFLDNYGVRNWKRDGGYVRGAKTFKFKDVEVRTSLIDHNDYLIDFTTAFEIKTGGFTIYHTGDSGRGTEPKLAAGRPDLWLFFPGCGIDVAKAVKRVAPKRIVFGHLWELGHTGGRLEANLVRRALEASRPICNDVTFGTWGDRII